jgi:hypothetical protein
VKSGTRVAAAVAVGYLLGRTRKMRWALTLAAAGATGRFAGSPGALVKQAGSLLGANPELKSLTSDVRGRLTEAGKAVAVSMASGRISALTEELEKRTESLRRPESPDEAADDAEEEDRVDAEGTDEDEDLLDEEEELRRPSAARRRRDVASDTDSDLDEDKDEDLRPTRSRARGSTRRSLVRRTARR